MIVHVVIREDQNHYGSIDTSITGVFGTRAGAELHLRGSRTAALQEGLRVCDEEESDPDWQVDWRVEGYEVEG